MMYYIREYYCKIPFIHMEQFRSHSKLYFSIRYIHNFYCFMQMRRHMYWFFPLG